MQAKPKGGRRLNYSNFLACLDLVAVKRFPKTFKEKGQQAATQNVCFCVALPLLTCLLAGG